MFHGLHHMYPTSSSHHSRIKCEWLLEKYHEQRTKWGWFYLEEFNDQFKGNHIKVYNRISHVLSGWYMFIDLNQNLLLSLMALVISKESRWYFHIIMKSWVHVCRKSACSHKLERRAKSWTKFLAAPLVPVSDSMSTTILQHATRYHDSPEGSTNLEQLGFFRPCKS